MAKRTFDVTLSDGTMARVKAKDDRVPVAGRPRPQAVTVSEADATAERFRLLDMEPAKTKPAEKTVEAPATPSELRVTRTSRRSAPWRRTSSTRP